MDEFRGILVTGGAGFLGSAIVRKLLDQYPQCQITILDKSVSSDYPHSSRLSYYQADITDSQSVRKVFEAAKPDAVIHTAGLIPPLNERYRRRLAKAVFEVNVDGTRNVLEACQDVHCRAFVYTSSCCVVTDDLNSIFPNIDETWPIALRSSMYGESKAQAEELVLASKELDSCILRPSVIFGEEDKQLIPAVHRCIAKGETPYIVGNGTNLWDTDYVGNVADAHLLALKNLLTSKSAKGERFFIQNNEPVPFRDLCLQIWKHFDHIPAFEVRLPESLGVFIGTIAEWYGLLTGQPTTLSRGSVMDACAIRYASGVKAANMLGHVPKIGLEEGLRISCHHYAQRLRKVPREDSLT